MMCAPCPVLDKDGHALLVVKGGGGACKSAKGFKDFKALGLKFGDSMKAKDLYSLYLKVKILIRSALWNGIYPCLGRQMQCITRNGSL